MRSSVAASLIVCGTVFVVVPVACDVCHMFAKTSVLTKLVEPELAKSARVPVPLGEAMGWLFMVLGLAMIVFAVVRAGKPR